ncbi:MAG: hypothetical protein AAF226_09050, partial [Verrucomicrobiota bacterium]
MSVEKESNIEKKPCCSCVTKLLAGLGIVILLAIATVFGASWYTKKTIAQLKDDVVALFSGFQPESVVDTFVEWRDLQVEATDGNILEVATAESTEIFKRTSDMTLFGKKLPLGQTLTEIKVPATYRFHIDLNQDWHITHQDNRLLVIAPEVVPTLPVAFDTGKMEKKSERGWGRWDAQDDMDALEKSITSELEKRAQSPETLQKVREQSREAVVKFLQGW